MQRLGVLGTMLAGAAIFVAVVQAQPGTQSVLTASVGQGTGHVLVSPTAKDRPNFDAQVTVDVLDMLPDSTPTVERRVDLNPDGVCTGTTWLTNGTITTSPGGAGAGHFEVERGAPFVSGVQFDVQFQVIGNGTVLLSDCFNVTVK